MEATATASDVTAASAPPFSGFLVPWAGLGVKPMWDPFVNRQVFLKDVSVTWDNSDPDSKKDRTLIYTTKDRRIYYVGDDGDMDDPPRAPGVQIDPRDLWPEVLPHWSRAVVRDDVQDYSKPPMTAEWYPNSGRPRSHSLTHFVHEIEVYESFRAHGHMHPNFCEYRGCEVDGGLVASIVLKHYPSTLRSALENDAPLDATLILDGLRSALAHLASLGLAHNDVSSPNVLLDENGQPFLADFECCLPYGEPLVWKWGTPGFAPDAGFHVSAKENDEFGYRAIADLLASRVIQAK